MPEFAWWAHSRDAKRATRTRPWLRSLLTSAPFFRTRKAMLEVAQIAVRITDLQERLASLRGYL